MERPHAFASVRVEKDLTKVLKPFLLTWQT
jgi:hypothetical protein